MIEEPGSQHELSTVDVICDDTADRNSLVRLLKAFGHRVRSVDSVESYLTLPQASLPCCVIVDLQLSEETGLDVLQRLRESHFWLPKLVLCDHADVAIAVRSMQLGADSVLEKDVAQGTLISAVRLGLQLSREFGAARDLAESLEQLTDRERLVLELLMEGQLYKAIARQIDVGIRTVERIRERILAKTRYDALPPLIRDVGTLKGVMYQRSLELPAENQRGRADRRT